jgi:hypothetical protein
MSGEESRENFNELFFLRCIRVHETIAHVEAMWALAAIQLNPVSRPLGTGLIQPFSVFQYAGFDFFEADVLRKGERRKK